MNDNSSDEAAYAPRVPARFTSLPTGTRLRQYIIREAVGAGGFGITYRAEHAALRSKSFALKEYFPRDFAYREGMAVHPTVGGEDLCEFGRARFLQEAEALALCRHPAIVDVIDYFEENGTAYAALEYVSGGSLGDWLTGLRRPPTQAELDALVGPLLDAMDVIHSHRLLHRDIAPDNILIRPDGMPCLIDFGAARSDMGQKAERTATFVKFGYSPPEQHLGEAQKQGCWTDIYAMGATLHRCIMGSPPPDAMRRFARSAEMAPMPEGLRTQYRTSFLAAIDQALEIEIERRPQSVAAWREMLMEGRPGQRSIETPATAKGSHRPPTVEPRAGPTAADTAKTEVSLPKLDGFRWPALLAVPMVVAALAILIWPRFAAAPPPVVTGAESGPATGPLAPTASKQAPPAVPTNATAPVSPPNAKAASIPDAAAAPADAKVEPSSSNVAKSVSANKPAPASSAAEPRPTSPPAPVPIPSEPTETADQLLKDCTSVDPDRKLAACAALLLATPPGDTRALYRAQTELGRARRAKRDSDGAIQAYDEAIKLLPNEADAYNQRGIAQIDKGQLALAVDDFSKAIDRNPNHGEAHNNRAWALFRLDRMAQGLADANAAVRLLPEKAFAWDTRAQINERLGNQQQAIDDYRKALELDPVHKSSIDGLRRLRVNQ